MQKANIWNIVVSSWNLLKKNPWLSEVTVFLIFLGIYLPLQRGTGFADPDAFYHLKITELIMARHAPVTVFGWLPFTTLATSYADHHFLYHLSLIPFIKIFGSFSGIKISTAVFAALAVAAFAWGLRRLGIKNAALFALVIGIMNPFAFRIGLAKASAVGVMLLIIGLVLAIERQTWFLGLVAFIYVWTHGGWPALLVLGTIAIVIMSWDGKLRSTFYALRSSLLALWLGAALGLVINPFFPQNLMFYWEQIIQIAVVNYQNVIGVGNEWYPYGFRALAADLPLLFILGAAALVIFPVAFSRERDEHGRKKIRIALALSAAGMLFLLMVLRSRRHVEYFVPLMAMAIAAWFSELEIKKIMPFLKKNFAPVILLILAVLSMTVVYGHRALSRADGDLNGGYRYTLYEQAGKYLIANTQQDEVVIHADWDEMPPLFYWDDKNRYMMGLDPTFMYSASHERYWDYVNFTLGKAPDPVAVMKEFGARFVLSDDKHAAFNTVLEKSRQFEKVYTDADARIYRLKAK